MNKSSPEMARNIKCFVGQRAGKNRHGMTIGYGDKIIENPYYGVLAR